MITQTYFSALVVGANSDCLGSVQTACSRWQDLPIRECGGASKMEARKP